MLKVSIAGANGWTSFCGGELSKPKVLHEYHSITILLALERSKPVSELSKLLWLHDRLQIPSRASRLYLEKEYVGRKGNIT